MAAHDFDPDFLEAQRSVGDPPADVGHVVVSGAEQGGVVESAEAIQRAERKQTGNGIGVGEAALGDRDVAPMAGDGQGAPALVHRRSMSVSVTTDHATANDTTVASTAPVTTAMPPLATTDQIFRHHGAGRWSGAGICEIGIT